MATAALVKCSAPSFKSHNKLRQHYKCLFEGYDTLRGVEMMQQYARRSKGAAEASKSEAESMASAATVPMKLCADCQTSKTPMWRKGPNGPKSLCNACGIRHKRNSRLRLNAESGGPKKLKSSRIARSGCCIHNPELSQEELKQRQKEKQKRLLLVLMQRQRQPNAQRRRPRTAAAERGGAAASRSGREEVEAAAFLLLSLSSGVSVR